MKNTAPSSAHKGKHAAQVFRCSPQPLPFSLSLSLNDAISELPDLSTEGVAQGPHLVFPSLQIIGVGGLDRGLAIFSGNAELPPFLAEKAKEPSSLLSPSTLSSPTSPSCQVPLQICQE